MTAERSRQAADLYRAALLQPAADRREFVAARCGGDGELQRAVESLLASDVATQAAHAPFESGGGALGPGALVGHYRIEGLLGAGGMGVIYRATDTRLNRVVAVKFLAQSVLDANARQRFQREAQTASALNHPHILTVHDVGEHAGSQYLVTELVDGGTLADWIHAEPRTWRQCTELMIGVADALAAAHAASILHRDIKPANIFVSRSGYAKLADFGLAKLADETPSAERATPTRTGAVLGTIGYMSPEHLMGRSLDARSDIFAFGVVLHEMLARRPAFAGATDVDVLHAIVHAAPAPLPADVPAALRTIVEKAVEKDPSERYQSMRDLVVDLRRATRRTAAPEIRDSDTAASASRAGAAAPEPQRAERARRNGVIAAAALLVVAALGIGYFTWNRAAQARWARTEAIPAIATLTDEGDYLAAFDLAQRAARYAPDDPLLQSLTPLFTATYTVTSTPAEANVFVRGYADTNEEWQLLGRTPLDASVARRTLRWRIEKDGFEPAELATGTEDDVVTLVPRSSIAATLQPEGTAPGMVFVPGGTAAQRVNGVRLAGPAVGPFFMDRYEVTNAAYKEFVDAGGYERRSYWDGLDLERDGAPLTWEDAMRLFVDTTGRPGPAAWELGDFPDGQDRHPVTGISWYEAAAYARYRNKSLPTVFHWATAALPPNTMGALTAAIVPASNYASAAAAAVGTYQSMGPFGGYDMHGNVSEWTVNRAAGGRIWAIGGNWQDAAYNFSAAGLALPPLERSTRVGLRLMSDAGTGTPPELEQALDLERPKPASRRPASDETYAAYVEQFSYQPGDLRATEPVVVASTDDWVVQRVSVDTGYQERMDITLFIPTSVQPPYQALVYFPPFDAVTLPGSSSVAQPGHPYAGPLDFIVKAGRVVVQPVFKGTYERFGEPLNLANERAMRELWIDWRWDMGRTLDYLATRADIDAQRIAYTGISFGGSFPLHVVALEPRLRAALLVSAGLFPDLPAALDPLHYAARIEIPTLMIGGRYDYVVPIESQEALFAILGTPAPSKRLVLVDAGHLVPRSDILRESLGWLDEHFGRVR